MARRGASARPHLTRHPFQKTTHFSSLNRPCRTTDPGDSCTASIRQAVKTCVAVRFKMSVPDFQALMLPLLRTAGNDEERPLAEARDALPAEFRLSDADRDELLPSGRQSKFSNRVAWAKSYLQQAGLLVSSRRGHFQISDRGRDVHKAGPPRISRSHFDFGSAVSVHILCLPCRLTQLGYHNALKSLNSFRAKLLGFLISLMAAR